MQWYRLHVHCGTFVVLRTFVCRASISAYEHGEFRPSIDTVVRDLTYFHPFDYRFFMWLLAVVTVPLLHSVRRVHAPMAFSFLFFLTPCKSSAPAPPIPCGPATRNPGMTPVFPVYTILHLLFMILRPLHLFLCWAGSVLLVYGTTYMMYAVQISVVVFMLWLLELYGMNWHHHWNDSQSLQHFKALFWQLRGHREIDLRKSWNNTVTCFYYFSD